MSFKSIHTAFSPNLKTSESLMALANFFFCWRTNDAAKIMKFEDQWKRQFNCKNAIALNSAREAIFVFLKAMNFEKDDEVIIQPFTCMVLVNSIVWAGLKPVYVDINPQDYNIDSSKIEEKISNKTRAIMVQHTFGIPSDIEAISSLCKKHNLLLLEDCAHITGGGITIDGEFKRFGTFGDAGFFSLGRSKVISCVSGGVLCFTDKHKSKVDAVLPSLASVPLADSKRNLLHLISGGFIKFSYSFFGLGKLLMKILTSLNLYTKEVTLNEKLCIKPSNYGSRIDSSLLGVAENQLLNMDRMNHYRRLISSKYFEALKNDERFEVLDPNSKTGAVFLRYPVLCKSKQMLDDILKRAKCENIILGDWYITPIAPDNCDISKSFYEKCEITESICGRVLNLPTIGLGSEDIEKVLSIVQA